MLVLNNRKMVQLNESCAIDRDGAASTSIISSTGNFQKDSVGHSHELGFVRGSGQRPAIRAGRISATLPRMVKFRFTVYVLILCIFSQLQLSGV